MSAPLLFYLYREDGTVTGPHAAGYLRQGLKTGELSLDHQACMDGTQDWLPISEYLVELGVQQPENHHWVAQSELPFQPATAPHRDPESVYKAIRRLAESKWPGDYTMQVYEIEQEEGAWRRMTAWDTNPPTGLSWERWQELRDRACAQWPNEYVMQVYEVEQQTEALSKLR